MIDLATSIPVPIRLSDNTLVAGRERWCGVLEVDGLNECQDVLILQLGKEYRAVPLFCPHDGTSFKEAPITHDRALVCPSCTCETPFSLKDYGVLPVSVHDGDFYAWISMQKDNHMEEGSNLGSSDPNELESLRSANRSLEQQVIHNVQQMDTMLKEVEKQKQQMSEKSDNLEALYELVNGIIDSFTEVLVVTNNRGLITHINTPTEMLLGVGTGSLIGCSPDLIIDAQDIESLQHHFPNAQWDDRPLLYQLVYRSDHYFESEVNLRISEEGVDSKQSGNSYLLHGSIRYSPQGKEEGMILVASDISRVKERENIRQEENAAKSFELLQSALQSLGQGVAIFDGNHCFSIWNQKLTQILEFSVNLEYGVTHFGEILQHEDDCSISSSLGLAQRTPSILCRKEVQWKYVFPEERHVEVESYPMPGGGFVMTCKDVTERVNMEEMLVQSEKMLSLGGLAAGMAHEINNPLAGILQSLQVVMNRLSKGPLKNQTVAEACGGSIDVIEAYIEQRGVAQMIQNAMESGVRASHIVENMLSFSQQSHSTRVHHNLSEIIDQTLSLAENEYHPKSSFDFKKIEILKQYQSEKLFVCCEKVKIQQVLFNILKNGGQAMSASNTNTPRFIIRLEKESQFVRIEIEDNGPGIDRATQKRIFEPFFTTKKTGEGTGLGLSVCYFIITENHQGTMSVISMPGKGTCFIVRLPIDEQNKE